MNRNVLRGVLIVIVLGIALALGMYQFPSRYTAFVAPVLPRARLWYDPHAQSRMTAAPAPYDLLKEADALLPRDARVLLVTDGSEVRGREYVTFHRALYYLLPRSVWWTSPAPSDGTWEARWWRSAPLTPESVRQVAQEVDANYLLLIPKSVQIGDARVVSEWQDGELVALDSSANPPQTQSSAFAGGDWWWRSAAAFLALFLAGTLWLLLAARWGLVVGRVEGFAVAGALGTGTVSFALVGLNALGLSLELQVGVVASLAVVSVVVLAVGLMRREKGLDKKGARGTESAETANIGRLGKFVVVALLTVWLAIQTAFVAVIAVGQPLVYWDSWTTWGMKARAIFVEQSIGGAVLTDPSRTVTHLDYPLLLPLVEAWLYQWMSAPDDRLGGLAAVLFFLALVALTYGGARRLGAGWFAALAAAAVVGSIPTITLLAGQVYADIPLAVYALLTSIYLVEWVERGDRGALLLAACGAACLPWIKREGLVVLFALCGTTLVLSRFEARVRFDTRAGRGALVCLAAGIVVAGAWALFLAAQGTRNSDFGQISIATAVAESARLSIIADYFSNSLVSLEWNGIWLLVIGVLGVRLLLNFTGKLSLVQPNDILLATPLVYLVVMGFSYVFSDYYPLQEHLDSSGYRLIAQVTPMLVVWLALQSVPRKGDFSWRPRSTALRSAQGGRQSK